MKLFIKIVKQSSRNVF